MAPNVALGAEGPVQRGWDLWLLCVVLVSVAGLVVAARICERLSRRAFGSDDFVALIALACSVLLSVTEIEAVKNGYGHHAATLSRSQIIAALKWFYVAQIMYKVVIMFDKIAILLFYYRVFKVDKSFRAMANGVNVFIVISNFSFIIVTIFQCIPVRGVWMKGFESTHCINSEAFWISYAVLNISTDVLLLSLPLNQIRQLNIAFLDKIGLALVFSTGLFFTAASIIRTTTLARSANDKDPTWGPLPATNWSVIEANVGLIAACLPTLRRPFIALFSCLIPRSLRKQPSITSLSPEKNVFGSGFNRRRDSDASFGFYNNTQRHHFNQTNESLDSKADEDFLNRSWFQNSSEEDLPLGTPVESYRNFRPGIAYATPQRREEFSYFTRPANDPEYDNWPLREPDIYLPVETLSPKYSVFCVPQQRQAPVARQALMHLHPNHIRIIYDNSFEHQQPPMPKRVYRPSMWTS